VGACCLLSARHDNNDERVALKGVFKNKKLIFIMIFIYHSVFKIFLFMCRQKTNISSQTDLVCKQSLDEKQMEITGTENREKHLTFR